MEAIADAEVHEAGFELVTFHYRDGSGIVYMIQKPGDIETLAEISHAATRDETAATLREIRAALATLSEKVPQ